MNCRESAVFDNRKIKIKKSDRFSPSVVILRLQECTYYIVYDNENKLYTGYNKVFKSISDAKRFLKKKYISAYLNEYI